MNQSVYLILQTAAETDRTLADWADYMRSDRYFELGRDPDLIAGIESELEQLGERLGDLGKYVQLGQTPVRQANSYFAARGELRKAAALAKEIRRKNQGSVANTDSFVTQLENCRHTFHEMMALLQPNISTNLH